MIILCLLIIIVEILNFLYVNNNETITDLLFGYSMESYHNNNIDRLHNVDSQIPNRNITYILDHILIYGIMLLSIWESLFSFYRYYTTFIATKKFQEASTSKVMKRFPIFAVIFTILFMIEMHLYYFVCPITILFFISFNFYCTLKFASMLIERYKVFIGMIYSKFISIYQ